jgi:hypothetical protein
MLSYKYDTNSDLQILSLLFFRYCNLHFPATMLSTSARMLSIKSFVVFVGFHPSFRALSPLERVLLPSQGP